MAAGTERLFMWAIECIFSSMKITPRLPHPLAQPLLSQLYYFTYW